MLFEIQSVQELRRVAEELLAFCDERKVIIFIGEIGAGKTTLITQICALLKVNENISSPTYSIVNEYESPNAPVFHIDLYRLKNIEEALGIGIEDYIYSGNYCFIEWPELIEQLLDPSELVTVKIETLEDNSRKIEFLKE